MKSLTLLTVLVLTLAAAAPALAENSPATRLSLKGLNGIGLRVEPIDLEADKDGLSTRAVQSAVESRLRKAGIRLLTPEQRRQAPGRPCLVVNVATSKLNTGEHLYSIHVELTQWVASLVNPKVTVTGAIPVPAKTWSPANRFGIAPANQIGRHAQGMVGTMVDEFVDAYYKANPGKMAFYVRRGGG